jgi:hypothetical protein
MARITDAEIEALAREMLRETIERSGWYPELRGEFRAQRIEQDVQQQWYLMVAVARQRLEEQAQGCASPIGTAEAR